MKNQEWGYEFDFDDFLGVDDIFRNEILFILFYLFVVL